MKLIASLLFVLVASGFLNGVNLAYADVPGSTPGVFNADTDGDGDTDLVVRKNDTNFNGLVNQIHLDTNGDGVQDPGERVINNVVKFSIISIPGFKTEIKVVEDTGTEMIGYNFTAFDINSDGDTSDPGEMNQTNTYPTMNATACFTYPDNTKECVNMDGTMALSLPINNLQLGPPEQVPLEFLSLNLVSVNPGPITGNSYNWNTPIGGGVIAENTPVVLGQLDVCLNASCPNDGFGVFFGDTDLLISGLTQSRGNPLYGNPAMFYPPTGDVLSTSDPHPFDDSNDVNVVILDSFSLRPGPTSDPVDCDDPDVDECFDQEFQACGNGTMEGTETCDDANTNGGDGCSNTCEQETGWNCTDQPSVCVQEAVCGNGVLEADETCDDNNTNGGDGCSNTCEQETGWNCTDQPSVCVPIPFCGDGAVNTPFEQCEPPGTATCDPNCQIIPPQPFCGDLIIQPGEQCEPPGTATCDLNCQLVQGPTAVGGEIISLDSTSLLIAGLQTSAIWMIPTLAALAGAGFYLVRFRTNKE